MTEVLAVLDDTAEKSELITAVIGDKGFSDLVVRRERLAERYERAIKTVFPAAEVQVMRSPFQLAELAERIESYKECRVLHLFASFYVTDAARLALTLKKLAYIETPYRLVTEKGETAGVMLESLASYRAFLARARESHAAQIAEALPAVPVEGLLFIGEIGPFIQCVTGSFAARYFNSVKGDGFLLTKSSRDKRKIRAEYTFYHLLPDDLKIWYVLPFDYREDAETASYKMQRLYITDLAIKWVHGSFDEQEFSGLLALYFRFFAARHEKEVTPAAYQAASDQLYVTKVRERVAKLEKLPAYPRIAAYLAAGTPEGGLDDIVAEYFTLKERVERRVDFSPVLVIGHGDPCFSNALYSRATRTLKFIDPKGALTEAELWANPYYDLAKLSHSVCGRYDFFNSGLYEITVGEDFALHLGIDFDNTRYKEIFREALAKNGYDYLAVRLYEASLFLSMLPLHIDRPHKVLGFILNARNILEEIRHEL